MREEGGRNWNLSSLASYWPGSLDSGSRLGDTACRGSQQVVGEKKKGHDKLLKLCGCPDEVFILVQVPRFVGSTRTDQAGLPGVLR